MILAKCEFFGTTLEDVSDLFCKNLGVKNTVKVAPWPGHTSGIVKGSALKFSKILLLTSTQSRSTLKTEIQHIVCINPKNYNMLYFLPIY